MAPEVSIIHERLAAEFTARFHHSPEVIVSAPGRVNLIGEHTDYNDGFVLPVAIDKSIHIAASSRLDGTVHLHALDMNDVYVLSVDINTDSNTPAWGRYLKGVVHLLQEQLLSEKGITFSGMSAVITGDVPIGAGLSSSAALTVAGSLAVLGACGLGKEHPGIRAEDAIGGGGLLPLDLASLCRRVEHEYAGVHCGIMDPTISLLGKAGHALFLDCRSLEYKQIPLNLTDISLVLCNTNVKRELASSAYNQRRAACEKGVTILQRWLPTITSLRDVTLEDLKKYAAELPPMTLKRCQYVVEENARVQAAVSALTVGDLNTFGDLMNASHAGLRDAYEVSCDELDVLTEIAQSMEGVIGARMTGAGFGGCTVNFVYTDAVEAFCQHVMAAYPLRTRIKPDIYLCNVSDGARLKWIS